MTVWAAMSPEQKARKLVTGSATSKRRGSGPATRTGAAGSDRACRTRPRRSASQAIPVFIGPKRPRGRPFTYPAQQSTAPEATENGAANI